MKRKKFYFQDSDSEMCYNEDYFQDIIHMNGMEEMEVFEAIPAIIGGGVFWCKEHLFCSDDSRDTCGRHNCDQYDPRNGKNGRCKHHDIWLFEYGNKITLKRHD